MTPPEQHAEPRWQKPALLGLMLAVALAVFWLGGARQFRQIELKLVDFRFQARGPVAPDPRIILVSVGQADLDLLGPWPWPRKYHADLVEIFSALGARAVGFDILFSRADEEDPASDRLLAQALARSGDVVLGGALGSRGGPDLLPLPSLVRAAAAVGLVNVHPDSDGVYRHTRLREGGYWCLAPLVWGVWSGAWSQGFQPLGRGGARLTAPGKPPLVPPVDDHGRLLVDYPCTTLGWRWVGVGQLLTAYIQKAQGHKPDLDLGMFRDAAVLVGSTHPGMPDVIETPLGASAYGVEFHAAMLNSLLTGRFLRQAPPLADGLVYAGLVLLLAALLLWLRPLWGGVCALALALGYAALGFTAFSRWGLVLELARPLAGLSAVYLAGAVFSFAVVERRSRELARAFNHYVSPEVVARLLREPNRLSLGGELKTLTILFSDIRGFTPLSEGLAPERLGDFLNDYFTTLSRCVFAQGGTLDKFIGDAVMVIYNAPLDQPDHAAAACRTAQGLIAALGEVNGRWAAELGRPVGLGVGIHTGPATVGNFGSAERFNYTALGEGVNLASRLEGLTRHYGVDIVISQATRDAAGPEIACRRLDRVLVKGASHPVDIHQVLPPGTPTGPDSPAARYEQALAAYQARDFAAALAALQQLPDDRPSQLLAARARQALTTPPPPDWDPSYRFTSK